MSNAKAYIQASFEAVKARATHMKQNSSKL